MAQERRGKIRGKQKGSENLLPKPRKRMWEQDLWGGKAKEQQWGTIGDGTGLNLEDNGYFSACGTGKRKSRMRAGSRINLRDEEGSSGK